jgi:hypothetical protein
LITVHDHAAIQVRVASGRRAAAALPRSLVFTAGAPAPTSLAPPPFSLQVHVAKVDVDGKAIRGQEDTYAICGYVRDKVRWPSLWPRARLRATDEPVPPRTMCWLRHSSGQNRCLYFAVPSLLSLSLSLSLPLRPQGEADMALTQLIKAQEEKEGKEGKSLKVKGL